MLFTRFIVRSILNQFNKYICTNIKVAIDKKQTFNNLIYEHLMSKFQKEWIITNKINERIDCADLKKYTNP